MNVRFHPLLHECRDLDIVFFEHDHVTVAVQTHVGQPHIVVRHTSLPQIF